MSRSLVERVADAVLYEGHVLYPYRPSVKNRQRWTFGGLYPQGSADASGHQTECLVAAGPDAVAAATVRFLHLTDRQVGAVDPPLPEDVEPAFRPVESLIVGERIYQSWQEAEERQFRLADVTLGEVQSHPLRATLALPARRWLEPIPCAGGCVAGVLVREQHALAVEAELSAAKVAAGLFRLSLRVWNRTQLDPAADALMRTMASTHAVLRVRGGSFVSLLDPPDVWRDHAAACSNAGVWPVLVGEPGQTDTVLASPIILYDYPQVAPESPGDLFDGTEIDEILSLRILTLTDEEKRQAAAIDERVGELLARTESLDQQQLSRLHGALRDVRALPGEAEP
jgi:hydrogenase maturation protease